MKNVPFYSNTADNLHCFEAGMKMILKYYYPHKDYSWEELEQISGKRPGLWTWPNRGMVALAKMGIQVKGIQDFDIQDFAKRGEQALMDYFGEKVAKEQFVHSDIPYEQQVAAEYVQHIDHEKRIPEYEDLIKLLGQGFLLGCNVNAKKLNAKEGYVGHFVLVLQSGPEGLELHDPGLPPQINRIVSKDTFISAWAYPNEHGKNIMAFRMQNDKKDLKKRLKAGKECTRE